GAVLRIAWCSPAVALYGTRASTTALIAAASSASSGYSSAFTPPVRNLAFYRVPGSAAMISGLRSSRGISTNTSTASSMSAFSSASTSSAAPCGAGTGTSSARSSTGNAATVVSTSGTADGPSGTVTVRSSRSPPSTGTSPASSSKAAAETTSGPTSSAYGELTCRTCAGTASASGASPGGKIAASSHSPLANAGKADVVIASAPARPRSTR